MGSNIAKTFNLLRAKPFENLIREGMYRFHPFPQMSGSWISGFTMDLWIHDGLLDSRWVLGYKVVYILGRSEGRAKRSLELLVEYALQIFSYAEVGSLLCHERRARLLHTPHFVFHTRSSTTRDNIYSTFTN